MSAYSEQTGPLELRRLAICFVLGALVLALTPLAIADCPPALIRQPLYRDDGIIDLCWVHPACFSDTVRAHLGNFVGPFFVSETAPDNCIAIRLPSYPATTMLHAVAAYFLGKHGVEDPEWSVKAAFLWSIHADSQGVPGGAIHPDTLWMLGDSASLRTGGWFRQTVDWWLPDSAPGGLWLVGRWPPTAREVVRLGADALSSPDSILMGYSDGTSFQWPQLDHGLLIEIELLRSQPAAGEGTSTAGSFSVVRDLLSGPLSPCADTATIAPGAPLVWHDSLPVVGQRLRYGIAPPCSTSESPRSWTPDFLVTGRCAAMLWPETLTTLISSGNDTALTISAENQGPESLFVGLAPVPLTKTVAALAKGASILGSLSPDPDSMILAPGEIRVITLPVPVSNLSAGTYACWPIARIAPIGSLQVERRSMLIRLDIDSPTSVDDREQSERNAQSRPDSRGSNLAISTAQNPFVDRIELVFDIGGAPQANSTNSRLGDADADLQPVEVIVYNSLGNKVKHQFVTIRTGLGSSGERASIVIDGTRRWPSGVYLVSVRWNHRIGKAKLLHLK